MRIKTFAVVGAIFSISVANAACSTSDVVSQRPSQQVSASPTPRVEIKPSPSPNPPIRSVDFANFTYRAKPIYAKGEKSFTLQNGKYQGRLSDGADVPYPVSLAYLTYGDVTGDGSEDAMVVLSENVKGTAIPYYVYIYTLEKGSPKLLWAFETGDRADGGLRQVYAESGELVIELYGKGTRVGGKLYGTEDAACCPSSFTRTRYKWQGTHFQQVGKEETLPNREGHGSPIMPRYGSSR